MTNIGKTIEVIEVEPVVNPVPEPSPSTRAAPTFFDAPDGNPLHPDHVSKRFKKLVRASGFHALTIHGLRHSHAAYLASKGAPPKVIQERLGHHSAAFTLDRYGHLFPSAQGITVELVSKALG